MKKRSVDLGVIRNLIYYVDKETSLEMFRRMCLIRYFELEAAEACKAKLINMPMYLSIGQEAIAAAISTVIPNYYIFPQHRAHSVYLAFGGDIVKLIDELLGKPTGCTGGIGGSAMIQSPDFRMV